ncbi:MAG: hypothetical protein ACRDAX_06055 [Propionibacteriaceae bacterium]
MLWFDRAGLDQDIYDSLKAEGMHGRPRVLAWAQTLDGVVVGLPDRLSIRRGELWEHLRWDEVINGGWDNQQGVLRWTTADGAGSISLEEPGRVPELFRERVQASIMVNQQVDIEGSDGITVTARRNPSDTRSELSWLALPLGTTDLNDPKIRALADEAVASIRSDWDIS